MENEERGGPHCWRGLGLGGPGGGGKEEKQGPKGGEGRDGGTVQTRYLKPRALK